jgi:hypothetical protein
MRFPGSSMVERSAVNRNVRGSSPLRGANLFNDLKKSQCTRMVQLSENCPNRHFDAAFLLGKTVTLCDVGAALRYVCVCSIAFLKSSSLTILYLSKMARVL